MAPADRDQDEVISSDRCGLETAGRFATASWLARCFAASGLLVMEQAVQQTLAGGGTRSFAATSRSNDFAATNRLRIAAHIAVTAMLLVVEQAGQQARPFGRAADRLTSTNRGFDAAGGLSHTAANRGFAATGRLSRTAAVAAALVKTKEAG